MKFIYQPEAKTNRYLFFFFPLTENLQSELRGKGRIHEHYQISIYYSYLPWSTRDLFLPVREGRKWELAALGKIAETWLPATVPIVWGVSNFQVHGTVLTSRTRKDEWLFIFPMSNYYLGMNNSEEVFLFFTTIQTTLSYYSWEGTRCFSYPLCFSSLFLLFILAFSTI